MARQTLGISWLNGRFHAAALAGGTVTASWSSPLPVPDGPALADAVAEAVRQTRFCGTQAMMILDHRNLLFHVQATPPAEGKAVDKILEGLVGRSRFFEEKAAWGRLALPGLTDRHRYLLALLPESLILSLVAAFASRRIELIGVFPVVAVLGDQLRLLAAQEGEAVLLAADLGDAIHLLLGTGDGQVLFSRTVATDGKPAAERVAQEINRTLHYAQEQFGATVNKLFVYGSAALAMLRNFPIRGGLAVAPSPVTEDAFYFARQVFLLSPKLRLNFIPPSVLKRRSNRQLATVAIVLLAAVSFAIVLTTDLRVRARERALQVQAQQGPAGRWRALLGSLAGPSILPETARLSRVDLQQVTNGWRVRIEGYAPDSEFIDVISELEGRLASGPFHLRILQSSRHPAQRDPSSPESPALPAKPTGQTGNERPFFIEGVIE